MHCFLYFVRVIFSDLTFHNYLSFSNIAVFSISHNMRFGSYLVRFKSIVSHRLIDYNAYRFCCKWWKKSDSYKRIWNEPLKSIFYICTSKSSSHSAKSFLIRFRTNAAAIKVRLSDTGIKNGSAYNPQIAGSKMGSPAPKTISRVIDRIEDSLDFPSDCRKIKEPLFTQARGKRQS